METVLFMTVLALVAAGSNVVDKLRNVENVLRTGVFSARVDVSEMRLSNGRERYQTTSFIEFHDGPRGVHSLKDINVQVEYFYQQHKRYKNFFRVANGNCETLALENDSGVLFPDNAEQNSDDFFLGPTGFVASVPSTDRVIDSDSVIRSVRGIETQMWDITSGTDIIRIYFAVDSWKGSTKAANVSFPLRIDRLVNNVLQRSYDFYQIELLQPDAVNKIMPNLLPAFVEKMCDLQSHLSMPKLGDAFAMVIQTRNRHGIHRTKEWYDSTIEVFRCDRELERIDSHHHRDSVISEISDFHRGLVYRTTMNTCEMVAARPQSTLLELGQLCLAPFIVEAFHSTNPSYVGKTVIRGLSTDVWQTNVKASAIVTARIYISSDAVVLANAPRRGSIKLPLRVDLKVANPSNVTKGVVDDWQVDIFDYELQSADRVENSFSIEDCSSPSTGMEMTLRSAGDSRLNVTAGVLEKLKIAAKKAVLTFGPISPLGVPYFRVAERSTSSAIRAVFKVLNPPTYLDSFRPRRDQMARYEEFAEKHTVDIEDCARICVQGNCATLIFCSDPFEDSCYLMKSSSERSWGEPTGDEICDVYDKTALGKFVYHSVEEIEQNLKQAISSSDLSFEISLGNRTFRFQADNLVKLPTSFSDKEGRRLFQTESKFYYIKPDHETSLYIPEVHTLGDCYRNCISNDHVACSVFSFCPSGPKCVLSSLNINKGTNPDPKQDEVLVPAPSICAVYSVSYLRNFHRQDGKMKASRSAVTDKGFSAEDCAFKCRQNKYDNLDVCRSFAFCDAQQSCSFYNEHVPAVEDMTLEEDPLCDHYALRFSADYTPILKGTLSSKTSVEVCGITVEECAQRCSEMSESDCTSFSHCERPMSLTSCYMYTMNFDGTERNRTDPNCTVYMKNEDAKELIRPSLRHIQKQIHIDGITDELFAGLLSCMLALGAFIGVVTWNSRAKLCGLFNQGPCSSKRTLARKSSEIHLDSHFDIS